MTVGLIQRFFCYDYGGNADLSKGNWNLKENVGNHAFFRDN